MERDGHIRVLPIHVANKIAAGEVVERPASALKELVENSIDAGADRIDITVTAGGRKLVSVRDNGCGMNREDAILSLERQATSKIRDVDDIERIDTLGFRGEAIPSIAAVSRFTIVTRRKEDEAATRIAVNAGTIAEITECGAPPGTCVEVRDLFCNVPARKKFLRSYATEEGHVKSVFTVSALAHPGIGLSLTIDGRELHRLAPGATLEERIAGLFGHDFADELVAIRQESEEGGDGPQAHSVSVHGYMSRPTQNSIRREQFVFVNGRPATAPTIAYAIKEAYPSGRGESRPSLFLFIDLPPNEVDVNVHPAKREVRFRHPADVKAAIVAAISRAIGSPPPQPVTVQAPVGDLRPFSAPFQPSLPPRPPSVVAVAQLGDRSSASPEPASPEPASPDPAVPEPAVPDSAPAKPATPTQFPQTPAGPWRTFKVLAATESGYLLLETDAGLVTLNPQAALERIAFDRLMANTLDSKAASQPLLIPETVHFSPLESARLKTFKPILVKQGFDLDELGTDTWKIDAVPAMLEGQNAAVVIASVVYDIGEAGMRRGDRWREELVARSVARSYAGTSRKFTTESATKLVEDLCRTKMPYVCPRGKPVMIFTSNRELSRKFGI